MAMNWAYIAGFFDGEGHIGAMSRSNGSFALNFSITQAGVDGELVLKQLATFMSTYNIEARFFYTTQKEARYKPLHRLYLSTADTLKALRFMLPWLVIKRQLAQDILRYRILFPNIRTSPMCHKWRSEHSHNVNINRSKKRLDIAPASTI